MNVQTFTDTNKQEMVVLPKSDYIALESKLESLVEQRILERDREEGIPHTFVHRVIRGENPIKVYREWRSMTQVQLAKAVKVSAPYIANMENGNREGSVKVLKKIADALSVDLDHIVANI